ncbi:DUF4252 domain-containing protein [Halosquirtibacter xylanolyticus]|uniref:DUF4252 domain-containing protein n=1 Tax=Halosquirtibacter xylanolyticus TaxID=3374599 RepID=UPI003749C25F|nr:DUF4252 domain-containing protein [Prolixibacteraceae bacterium]
MKNKSIVSLFLLMMLVLPMSAFAKSGISIFHDKCSGIEGIQRFSFSGSWFDCSKFVSDIDFSSMAEQTKNVSVMISSDDKDKVLNVWNGLRKDLKYKKMMTIHSDDKTTISCWARMKSRKDIQEIVLIVSDDDSLVTVGLEGNYTMEQIKAMSKNMKMTVE